VIAAVILVACAPAASPVDPYCEFPPGTPLVFEGETTLTALGLDQLGPVEAHDQVGMIYVTVNEMEHEAIFPAYSPARVYCGIYGEDQAVSAVIGWVPDDWQPPAAMPSAQ
jgi:hypothetical protein